MLTKSFSKTKSVCKVTFTLPADAVKNGKDVRVLGDFNNWSWENGAKMKASKKEYTAAVELEAGKAYEFRYLIDNHIWENDWAADAYVTAAHGVTNSVVNVAIEKTATKPAAKKAVAKPAAKKTATNAKAASDVAAPAAKPAVAKAATKPAAKKVAAKPATKKAAAKPTAKKTTADDLTKIEGVGPKIAGLLKDAKIVTFADLAKADLKSVKAILEAAGKRYQMHDPSSWSKQATLAAKGEWTKLTEMQDLLKGGKVARK